MTDEVIRKVLIVGDEKDMTDCLAALISNRYKSSIEITVANSFVAAQTCLQNQNFDLVISDEAMPDGSGRKLFDAFKSKFESDTTFLMFNGTIKSSERFIAVPKPNFDELLEAIEQTCALLRSESGAEIC